MIKEKDSLNFIHEWIQKRKTEFVNSQNREKFDTRQAAPVSLLEPIAITGLSGFFPHCMNVQSFWDHVDQDELLITEIPQDRFDWKDYYDPTGDEKGSMRAKWGGFIPDIASFDPGLFNISPVLADEMDPAQRLLLLSTWRTLEDAGIEPQSLKKSNTGVFIGCESNDYAELLIRCKGLLFPNQMDSMLANRISYHFDLSGPSEFVNTMCSSFASALNRAVVALRAGSIDRAIVGAANVILLPEPLISLSQAGQLSSGKIVKSFGQGGDGFLRSEGVGTVLLERMTNVKDCHRFMYATIKHSAVNYNGQGGMSIASPNTEALTKLIKTCYQEAGIDPRQVAYIEAQGMGLPVTDIAEWTAMNRALTELCEERRCEFVPGYCRVSTLKPMMGHMQAASSLGALLRILRSFQTKKIHKVLGYTKPNEFCDMENTPCRIVTDTESWQDAGYPRLAAFHSFGAGGNNAHVLLEEIDSTAQGEKKSVVPRRFDLMRCWIEAEEEIDEINDSEEQVTEYPNAIPSIVIENVPLQTDELDKVRSLETVQAQELEDWLSKLLWGVLDSCGMFSKKAFTHSDLLSKKKLVGFYGRWMEEVLSFFRGKNYLSGDTKIYTVSDIDLPDLNTLWNDWDRQKGMWRRNANKKAQVALVEACLRNLPDILAGKKQAKELIFPDSSMDLVEGLYKDNAVTDLFNEILGETLSVHIKERLSQDASSSLRILEVGVGVGGTTAAILRKIRPYGDRIAEYCCTDLSKSYLFQMEENLAPKNSFLRTEIFDVGKPLVEQNITSDTYDFVIAGNAIHATKNIQKSLQNVKAALHKNGLLLLNEISDKSLFGLLTFGLLEGWWLAEDGALRIPGSPGLYPQVWEKTLKEEGFDFVFFPAKEYHGLGQQIVAAKSDGIVRQTVPIRIDRTPVQKPQETVQIPQNGKASGLLREKSIEYFKKLFGKTLRMPLHKIDHFGIFGKLRD